MTFAARQNIIISDGASPGSVDLSFLDSQAYGDSGNSPAVPSVTLTFAFDFGQPVTVVYAIQSSPASPGDWLVTGTNDGLWEIRITQNSGDTVTGDVGAGWLTLGSDRYVAIAASGVGIFTASLTAEIRYDGGAVLTTATFTLVATMAP
jgi:hypothetical protein